MKSKITPRKLNKSIDERLLKPTDLIDAINVAIRTDSDGQGGVVKNVEGNAPATFLGDREKTFPGDNIVIGSVSDDAIGAIYFFVYNSTGAHSVWSYSTETNQYRLIFTDPLLNFPANGFVSADLIRVKRAITEASLPDAVAEDENGGSNVVDGDEEVVDPFTDPFFPDEDDFGEADILGCTDPTAYNYDPNANTSDGSCVLPIPTQLPYAIGVDMTPLFSHIYGNGFGATAHTGNVASANLHDEMDGGSSINWTLDPFNQLGFSPEATETFLQEAITAKISFFDEDDELVDFYGLPVEGLDLNPLIRLADEDFFKTVGNGFQFLSQGSLTVDGNVLNLTRRAEVEIRVFVTEQTEIDLENWFDHLEEITGNSSWNNNANDGLYSDAIKEWTVPVYLASERDGQSLLSFLQESDSHLVTNAVGFMTENGILAGPNAANKTMAASMEDGSLYLNSRIPNVFDHYGLEEGSDVTSGGLLSSGNFGACPLLLFPGIGFGCDTPHIKVQFGGSSNVMAGGRKATLTYNANFESHPDWPLILSTQLGNQNEQIPSYRPSSTVSTTIPGDFAYPFGQYQFPAVVATSNSDDFVVHQQSRFAGINATNLNFFLFNDPYATNIGLPSTPTLTRGVWKTIGPDFEHSFDFYLSGYGTLQKYTKVALGDQAPAFFDNQSGGDYEFSADTTPSDVDFYIYPVDAQNNNLSGAVGSAFTGSVTEYQDFYNSNGGIGGGYDLSSGTQLPSSPANGNAANGALGVFEDYDGTWPLGSNEMSLRGRLVGISDQTYIKWRNFNSNVAAIRLTIERTADEVVFNQALFGANRVGLDKTVDGVEVDESNDIIVGDPVDDVDTSTDVDTSSDDSTEDVVKDPPSRDDTIQEPTTRSATRASRKYNY